MLFSIAILHRPAVEAARGLLFHAIEDRIFPAAVAEVGESHGVLWREALGTLTFDEAAPATHQNTVFDLSSLTKPIATTSMVMQLVADAALDLGEPVARSFPEWRGEDRAGVTVQDLLEHSSGLAARLVDAPPGGTREFEHDICTMRLEYEPRTKSIYSDLGFILLGLLVADRARQSLPTLFERVVAPVMSVVRLRSDTIEDQPRDDQATDERAAQDRATSEQTLAFGVRGAVRARTAPTWPLDDDVRRGRLLVGEVHDNYAGALGGAAGHAGLFGTASSVGDFARAVLRGARGDRAIPAPLAPALVARATRKTSVSGSSRALGWDTMLPTSSCGTGMSPAAFGHVGFTGSSLWIDPVRDRYFVLLTNRVCGGGTMTQMRDLRRAFHDALADL